MTNHETHAGGVPAKGGRHPHQPPPAPLPGCGLLASSIRWCRCAQPPATSSNPSGITRCASGFPDKLRPKSDAAAPDFGRSLSGTSATVVEASSRNSLPRGRATLQCPTADAGFRQRKRGTVAALYERRCLCAGAQLCPFAIDGHRPPLHFISSAKTTPSTSRASSPSIRPARRSKNASFVPLEDSGIQEFKSTWRRRIGSRNSSRKNGIQDRHGSQNTVTCP